MKYAHYKADGTADVITTEKPIQYEQLRELVGGNIEAYTTQHGEHVYLHEEGRLIGLPSNPFYFEDIKGDVLEFKEVDGEGESLGWSDEEFALRTLPKLPEDLFKKGEMFTIFWVSDSWGATVSSEIKVTGDENRGKPVFALRGKRKRVLWNVNNGELMIFRGWDLPLINAADMKKQDGVFSTHTIRMNAMFNLAGLGYEQMRGYVRDHQINPFFILHDHINHVSEEGVETLLFPTAPATSQRIADMQSEQLKDGVTRIVMK